MLTEQNCKIYSYDNISDLITFWHLNACALLQKLNKQLIRSINDHIVHISNPGLRHFNFKYQSL